VWMLRSTLYPAVIVNKSFVLERTEVSAVYREYPLVLLRHDCSVIVDPFDHAV